MLYELAFNKILFSNEFVNTPKDIYKLILTFDPSQDPVLRRADPALKELLLILLNPDPKERFANILPGKLMGLKYFNQNGLAFEKDDDKLKEKVGKLIGALRIVRNEDVNSIRDIISKGQVKGIHE